MEMKQEQIIEGNKLIARYMEAIIRKGDENSNSPTYTFKTKPSNHPDHWHTTSFQVEHMLYNVSWDWLMPVVEKIGELGYSYRISEFGCDICKTSSSSSAIASNDRSYNHNSISLILAVWLTVVEFIKWYNTTYSNES